MADATTRFAGIGVVEAEKSPIAPLHFVKRTDQVARQVFAANHLETDLVLPHFPTLRFVAEKYSYSRDELEEIERRLRDVLVKKAPANWTPHFLWREALLKRPGDSKETYFEAALARYKEIETQLKQKRRNAG